MASMNKLKQEEIMYEAITNPPKGKGKEKDVGKRRAYVRVVTSLGGGSLNLELFCEKVTIPNWSRDFINHRHFHLHAVRPQRHVTTFLCLPAKENTMTVSFIGLYLDLW
jgi:hypothetical protein